MKIRYLINPFERIAGWPALLIGLCVMALTAVFGRINQVAFDGALDVHTGPTFGFAASFIMQAVDLLALFLSMWLAGVCFSATKIRAVDVAGTVALSRTPMLLLALISFLPIVPTGLGDAFINEYLGRGDAALTGMIRAKLIVFIIVSIPLVIWMIALMYHAFSVSCRMKGARGVVAFIGALLVAEVMSKCIFIFLFSGLFANPGPAASAPAPVVGGTETVVAAVADTAAIRRNAIQITEGFRHDRFDAVVACFDDTMKKGLSADNAEKAWQQYTGPLGSLTKFDWENTVKARREPYEIMEIPCIFDKGKITLRLVFNKDGTIGGLFIR